MNTPDLSPENQNVTQPSGAFKLKQLSQKNIQDTFKELLQAHACTRGHTKTHTDFVIVLNIMLDLKLLKDNKKQYPIQKDQISAISNKRDQSAKQHIFGLFFDHIEL